MPKAEWSGKWTVGQKNSSSSVVLLQRVDTGEYFCLGHLELVWGVQIVGSGARKKWWGKDRRLGEEVKEPHLLFSLLTLLLPASPETCYSLRLFLLLGIDSAYVAVYFIFGILDICPPKCAPRVFSWIPFPECLLDNQAIWLPLGTESIMGLLDPSCDLPVKFDNSKVWLLVTFYLMSFVYFSLS